MNRLDAVNMFCVESSASRTNANFHNLSLRILLPLHGDVLALATVVTSSSWHRVVVVVGGAGARHLGQTNCETSSSASLP